ncbi:UDP-glucuronosyl and UDP-glucosyl transferase [Handroanthus impetiginosus]|uniref:UDP-glucuronosyl and UDP-glucosyl transferase n=1 Tax=Handroanthus impetiginosus TaxID=429701 RepID=A0A2G9HPS0_9LAMI|nr:UDP-glucuronosyl and UDP-glucosyl transferase [Handroanthus impetiginosus]
MSNRQNGVHILVFPFPAQGHMLPLLDLTHQLALRGLTITILITPKNLPILNPILSSNPSIQTLVFPFPPHPLIPPGVENIKDLGNQGNIPIITALSRLQEPIIQWFESHSNPPVAVLSDFFLGWTHHLAQQIGIPRVTFYSSPAFSIDIFDHLWDISEAVKPGEEIKFHDLPRAPSFAWYQIPSMFRRYIESDCNDRARFEAIKDSAIVNRLSWASIYNTFEELEDEFLEYFRKKLGHSRVFAVGPLNMIIARSNDANDKDVIRWLDQWDDGSVLYVCFGSQKLLKKAQMEALAIGLERSGVRFIWVVKPLTAQQVEDGYGFAPDGFEDRVKGRGFVINGWAPQKSILSHRAVGGFLSHCGWNSILEAIAAGAMILSWPMEAEQFVSARLLVEYRGAAVIVCEGGDTVPDSDELARKITESMHEDKIERVRAKELRNKALEATKVGGRSHRGLDELVQELDQLKAKNV